MKRKLVFVLFGILVILSIQIPALASTEKFADVEESHWAYDHIHKLRELGFTNGMDGVNYGIGQPLTRAQFVAFLGKLMQWSLIRPESGSYEDNQDTGTWYFPWVETALEEGIIEDKQSLFRPEDLITREEMAIMIVNALGYGWLAQEKSGDPSPFTDVSENVGYMILLSDFNIVNGMGDGTFGPGNTALREHAAKILMLMYEKMNHTFENRNTFYRDSSYSQVELIPSFDSVSYGWADLVYDDVEDKVLLKDTKPSGYMEAFQKSVDSGTTHYLAVMGFNSNPAGDVGLVEKLIGDRDNVKEVAAAIASLAKSYAYDGVVIDFEEIKGEALAKAHGDFLFELKETLGELTLITAVQPRDYYDGYDYARIGDISDGIILMAHDYNTKRLTEAERQMPYTMTPVAPIKDVYRALADISDPVGGIKEKDLHKVSLQISMGVAQWQIKDGYVLNAQPYTPTYDKVHNRLVQEGEGAIHYNMVLRSPKATYISEDGTENVIWYEDSRSVEEKLGLAAMFGIKDLSIWRLGNIPNYDDGSHLDILDTFLAK